ncbi:MAG TPA: tetratricopeptide repeat protein [Kofleriaceae bacterium]|nr:tetratricopeptide repeat protein [Kofleriaceae bacterium]
MRKLVACVFAAGIAVAAVSSPAVSEPAKRAVQANAAQKPPPKDQVLAVRAHLKAAWSAQKAKRWADAVTELEAALKISPGNPRLLSELGWSAMNAGDYVKAKKADEESVRLARDNKIKAAGLYNLGMVQLKLNDQPGARASFAASLALRPNKIVAGELARLGGAASPTAAAEDACPAGKPACYCAVAADTSSPSDEDLAGCHESTTTKSPVPGWKVYTIRTGHGTAEQLLDEHNQYVTTIDVDDSRMRHTITTELTKAEIKTIAGHRVVWLEVEDNDLAQWMDDNEVIDDSSELTRVTICTIGDAKTPTRCPVRDAPRATEHASDHSTMLDDGSLKPGKRESTETTLDIAISADGTVTVKLVKGSASEVPAGVLGPHKLW